LHFSLRAFPFLSSALRSEKRKGRKVIAKRAKHLPCYIFKHCLRGPLRLFLCALCVKIIRSA
jgi:hypothetical protein